MSKFAVCIVMDEEHMRQDGYDIEKVHRYLDTLLVDRLKLVKDEKEHLYAGDDQDGWSSVWAGIDLCKEKDWFKKYVKQWEYLTNAYSDDENVFEYEDLIHEYREMGVM